MSVDTALDARVTALENAPAPTGFTPVYGAFGTATQIGKDFENNPVYQVTAKFNNTTAPQGKVRVSVPNNLEFGRVYDLHSFFDGNGDLTEDFNNVQHKVYIDAATSYFDICWDQPGNWGTAGYVHVVFSAYRDE